jgi:hypothetical protein
MSLANQRRRPAAGESTRTAKLFASTWGRTYFCSKGSGRPEARSCEVALQFPPGRSKQTQHAHAFLGPEASRCPQRATRTATPWRGNLPRGARFFAPRPIGLEPRYPRFRVQSSMLTPCPAPSLLAKSSSGDIHSRRDAKRAAGAAVRGFRRYEERIHGCLDGAPHRKQSTARLAARYRRRAL